MHASIALPLLLAAGALAKPHAGAGKHAKRALITETDYTVVYETVYVTEGAAADATTTVVQAAASTAASSVGANNLGLSGSWWTNLRHGSNSPSSIVSIPSTTLSTVHLSSTTTLAAGTTTLTTSTPVTSKTTTSTIVSTSSSAVVISATSVAPASTSSKAASSSIASTSTSSATGTGPSPDADYVRRVLLHHNVHRANHSAPNAVWSDSLYAIALAEANMCIYAHNTTGGGGGYGQNIAAGVPASNVQAVITDLFYNGEVNWFTGYGQANPDFTNFAHWGHFSQVVWVASTNIACATVDCSATGLGNVGSGVAPYFTVCNYQAVGNFGGEYGTNILPSLGHATVPSTYNG